MSPSFPTVLLVGCGNMGSALLQGWLKEGMPAKNITIVEPQPLSLPRDIKYVKIAQELPYTLRPQSILFAVKPQLFPETLPQYHRFLRSKPLIISIAVGKTLKEIETLLAYAGGVVRSMPNMPAAIGRGVIACVGNEAVTEDHIDTVQQLLGAVGTVAMMREEKHMDAVTAVSGSGPAYLYLFVEALQQAAVKVGLPADFARFLAVETLAGSLAMVQETGAPVATLREQVTSKGGTTAAALDVLQRDPGGLIDLITEAVQAAKTRAEELSGGA